MHFVKEVSRESSTELITLRSNTLSFHSVEIFHEEIIVFLDKVLHITVILSNKTLFKPKST